MAGWRFCVICVLMRNGSTSPSTEQHAAIIRACFRLLGAPNTVVPAPRPFGKLRACFHGDRLRGKAKSVRFCDILCAS